MADDVTKTTQQRARAEKTTTPSLRVLFAAGQGITLSPPRLLRDGAVQLGRTTDEPELLSLRTDGSMSRTHALVTRDGTSVTIKDGGSRNGTFVNGAKVATKVLEDGDLVRVGGSLVLFRDEPGDIEDHALAAILGRAPTVRALRQRIAVVAPTPASVLLLGESGVGKSLVAKVLHEASGRRGPFVSVNCAAIPETLAESQLFGHVAGAFTGAQKAHEGFFRAARGGTLFLDELAELPLPVQAKLLGVLEERKLTPVGSVDAVPIDVRVVAATNANLERAIAEHRFRGDLFARLDEVSIDIPPLRARREDVLALFQHALGDPPLTLTCDLAEALVLHAWPFNVRELHKVALDLRIRARTHPTAAIDLPLLEDRLKPVVGADDDDDEEPSTSKQPPPTRDELARLLEEKRGVISQVALAVGRSRKQVYRWIEQYGLARK